MSEVEIGKVVDYFTHVEVAAIEITDGELNVGDTVHIIGHTTDVMLPVTSMQLEHHGIEHATRGMVIGIRCEDRARIHDKVYRVAA
ncbi:translation elongation factor-like protein [bacterium]|nr:translation elongation factor-like protein [bacterium]